MAKQALFIFFIVFGVYYLGTLLDKLYIKFIDFITVKLKNAQDEHNIEN